MATAFDDKAGRQRFFAKARIEGADPGTAIDHAYSTMLGIWADANALKIDCARIFACELKKMFQLAEAPLTDKVLASSAFHHAFMAARRDPAVLLQANLAARGIQALTSEMVTFDQYQRPATTTALLHEEVMKEIGLGDLAR